MVQPPDGVNVTEISQSAARVSWFSVPGVLLYQVSVIANNKPGLAPLLWNVTGTAMNISKLEPCLTYTIGVASINMFLEPGESANVTYTTSSESHLNKDEAEHFSVKPLKETIKIYALICFECF